MSDYIKREDAINEIKRFGGYIDDDMIYRINTAIFRIPTADVIEIGKPYKRDKVHVLYFEITQDDYGVEWWTIRRQEHE